MNLESAMVRRNTVSTLSKSLRNPAFWRVHSEGITVTTNNYYHALPNSADDNKSHDLNKTSCASNSKPILQHYATILKYRRSAKARCCWCIP